MGKDELTAIMETWWDESHDWNTLIEDYRLFRRDRQGRRGGGVALYVRMFVTWKNVGLAKSRARTLCFRRANLRLLKELLSGIH